MSLTAQQVAAVRELGEIWPDTKLVVIGASALGFYYDMRWRKTSDVDLAATLELEDFPGPLLDRKDWQQSRNKEHEFLSPQGAKIDLLPAGSQLLAAGKIAWPGGHVMSLSGMDLAFDHAEQWRVDDHPVLVAPPPVVTILKMVSYCDRPVERERDLADISHLLDGYVDELSERRWEDAVGQEYELAPAYLLGLDIGRVAPDEAHHEIIDAFLGKVLDPDSYDHALMRRKGPDRWREEDALARCLDAFCAGRKAAEV